MLPERVLCDTIVRHPVIDCNHNRNLSVRNIDHHVVVGGYVSASDCRPVSLSETTVVMLW